MRSPLTVSIVCCLALTALAPASAVATPDPELAAALSLAKQTRTILDEAISRDPSAPGADPLHRLDRAEGVLRERTLDPSGRGRKAAARALIELYATVIERASWSRGSEPGETAVAERAVPFARKLLDLMRDPTLPARLRDTDELTRPARTAVLVLALADDPRNPGLLAILGEASYDPRLQAALFGAALEAPRLAAEHPRLAAWLLAQRVSALLELGLAEQAIAEVARTPAPARDLVRHGAVDAVGAVGAVALDAGFLTAQAAQLTLFDLRLELAAAHALAGEPSAAAGILATLPPRTPTAPESAATGYDPEINAARSAWLHRATLEHLLAVESGLATEDPFSLFLTILGIDDVGGISDAVWRRTAARLAEATGYPQIGRDLLTTTCRWLRPDDESELNHLRRYAELPRAVAAEWDALGSPIASALVSLLAHLDSLAPRESWLVPSFCLLALPNREVGETSTRALVPPGTEIEPLPGRFMVLDEEGEWRPPGTTSLPDPGGAAPPGLSPAAYFTAGREVLAVGLPADAESSWGLEYQIVLSPDGGQSWGRLHRLGIPLRNPFEIVPDSRRSGWTGGRLTLEVGLYNDGDVVGVQELAAGRRALLVFDPESALSDRDGDTLSDLEERDIGTDPGREDSDDDGIPDDRDRLPHAAFGGHSGDVPEDAFAAAIERIFFKYSTEESAGPIDEQAGRRLGPEDTVFLAVRGGSANPIGYPPLARAQAPLRISLVDPAVGDHTPEVIAIEIFELDRERRNAIVVWNEGRGRGWGSGAGRFLMTLGDDGWAVPIEVRNGGGCVTMRIVEAPGDAE